MITIAIIKYVNDAEHAIKLKEDRTVPRTSPGFLSELPDAPEYNPVRAAVGKATDTEIAAALHLFASMPPSTGVFANPVRYHHRLSCNGTPLELNIRSFGIRGCLLEEDIVTGSADAFRTIFVGLFGRFAGVHEGRAFSQSLSRAFKLAVKKVLPTIAQFMKAFPHAA